ncbi:hypothetical protein R6Q57_006242 [Mikania cordata]
MHYALIFIIIEVCSGVAITPSLTSDHCSSALSKLQSLASEFISISDPIERIKHLLHYASLLPQFDDSLKIHVNQVMGCTTQVQLDVRLGANGKMRFLADSDSDITEGFFFLSVLDGATRDEFLELKTEDMVDLSVNTWHNVLIRCG